MSEVKILTGALLHENELLRVQLEVIKQFLITHPKFSSLTTAEVKHAFYLNMQGAFKEVHKHYNKELNAEFVGNVLLSYVTMKREVHTKALPKINTLLNSRPEKPKLKATPEYMMWKIQMDYENYKAGQEDLIFYHEYSYYFLRRCELIWYNSRAHWWKWYYNAFSIRRQYAYSKPLEKAENARVKELRAIYDEYAKDNHIPMHEHRTIIRYLQLRRYLYFFECLKTCAINNIFNEVNYKQIW